tara:strand:- start:3966 stop:4289 length:324 start_codon:yes stop_codon:yes gene_type:complete
MSSVWVVYYAHNNYDDSYENCIGICTSLSSAIDVLHQYLALNNYHYSEYDDLYIEEHALDVNLQQEEGTTFQEAVRSEYEACEGEAWSIYEHRRRIHPDYLKNRKLP